MIAHSIEWINGNHDVIVTLATVIIAIFTFTLWWATRGLLKATYRTVALAQEELTSTNRAFVFVNRLEQTVVGSTRDWSVETFWENSGNTPTKNLSVRLSFGLFSDPAELDFSDQGSHAAVHGFIGPKSIVQIGSVRIPEATFLAGSSDDVYLLVWGWADYDDVFPASSRHRTEVCFRIMLRGDPYLRHGIIRYVPYPKHNAADDTCQRQPAPYSAV